VNKPSYTSRRDLLNLIMGGAVGLSLAPLRPAAAETVAAPAGLSPPESAMVAAVIDGDTIQLAGGTVLRLAGIEAPKRDLVPGDDALAGLEGGSTGALKDLVGARPITLRLDAGTRDRYGRRLAHAFNSDGVWLQAALVAAGQSRVRGDGRNRVGLGTLLGLEARARDSRQGLWRHWAFAVRAADDPQLERLTGTFQIVEGRVFAAAVVKGTGFINFGADRHTDLTLVLKKPALDLGGPAMMDLSWLALKPIRCRGWLDSYHGPRIDVSHPEQIEVLGG
jgi:micrococcal nuclease